MPFFDQFYISLKIKIINFININFNKIVNKFLIKNDKIFCLLKTQKNEKFLEVILLVLTVKSTLFNSLPK